MRVKWAAAVVTSLLVLLPASTAKADGAAELTDVHVSGRQLSLTVRVTGLPAGRSLSGAETEVRVGGTPVPTRVSPTAASGGRAAKAVLVVDTSGSMGDDGIAAARAAARAYARRVPADVPVGLVRFSDRPAMLVAPTVDRGRLSTGLARLRAGGGTSLYDAVALAVSAAGRDGSVVVLSDGSDTSSRASLQSAASKVSSSGVSVSTIAFRTGQASRAPLEQLARAGAGRVVAADGARSLADAFSRAAEAVPAVQRLVVDLPNDTSAGALQVTVGDGTSRWLARGSFGGGAGADDVPLPATVVGSGHWYTSLWPVLALVFLAVGALGWLALPRPASAATRRENALAAYTLHGHRPTAHAEAAEPKAESSIVAFFERLLHGRDVSSRIAEGLDRAGSRLRPAEWLVLRACVCVGIAAVITVLSRHLIVGVLFGGVIGWLGSFFWLRFRQVRRTRAFADALPDTLQLVASSLRTGFSLPQALDAAQQDGVQPIAGELGRALAAARIGSPLEDELEEVGKRMQNEDWRWAVMAIRIQRSVGGNLAEVLLTTVKTLRERAATRRQVRALSAEGLLSAYLLIGLPIFVSVVLLLFRREYLSPLWTTLPGIVMVLAAVLLLVAGSFWMRKVVKVEV